MQIISKLFIFVIFAISVIGCDWILKKKKASLEIKDPITLSLQTLDLDSNIWISHFENLTGSIIYIDTTWYFYDDAPAKGHSKLQL